MLARFSRAESEGLPVPDAPNTWLRPSTVEPGGYDVVLRETPILTFTEAGPVRVNPSGWLSATVKERLNRYAPGAGVVHQHRGAWFVGGRPVWWRGTGRRSVGRVGDRSAYWVYSPSEAEAAWVAARPACGWAKVLGRLIPAKLVGRAFVPGRVDLLPVLADACEDEGLLDGPMLAMLRRGEMSNVPSLLAS